MTKLGPPTVTCTKCDSAQIPERIGQTTWLCPCCAQTFEWPPEDGQPPVSRERTRGGLAPSEGRLYW